MIKKLFFIFISISICLSEDFSDGPYGNSFFDIAGPFSVPDLNLTVQGDPNLDEIVNIQDVILVVSHVLGSNTLVGESYNQANYNNDNVVDILDILAIINLILNPQDPLWDFENKWTGNESYIFIQYNPSVSSSTALWSSNTKEELLNISPDNVHYFFISDRAQFESDIEYIKGTFDDITNNLSSELQFIIKFET